MDLSRHKRYQEKMSFIMSKLDSIPESIKSDIEINATLYCVQVAIDAVMDICAMFVKDIGRDVDDDYHNVNKLVKEGIISAHLGEQLRRFNGLRNAIVHKYNTFEEVSVIKNLNDIEEDIMAFLEIIERKLNDYTQKNKK